MDHYTWWGGQTKGTTKKENRVRTTTIDACGQALLSNLSRLPKSAPPRHLHIH